MKRSLLLLILLLFGAFSVKAQTDTPTPIYCHILPPIPTPEPTYPEIVLGTEPDHLLAYWKLDEVSGTVAVDSSGNGRDGAYSGVTLNAATFVDGSPAPSFDGVNDFVNIYSSSLVSAFDGQQGTISVWVRVANAGVWTDGTSRQVIRFSSDSNNFIFIRRVTTNNILQLRFDANSIPKIVNHSTSTTDWLHAVVTWDDVLTDEMVAFIDGIQTGATQSGIGTWSGLLGSGTTLIGSSTTSSDSPFFGNIAHVALWDTPLSPTQIAALADVPIPSGVTPTPPPPCVTPDVRFFIDIPGSDQVGELRNSVTAGQLMTSVLLFCLVVLIVLIFVYRLRRGRA